MRTADFQQGMRAEAGTLGFYSLGPSVVLPKGRYGMTVEVETGAPGLAGRDSTVYSRLRVCELETLPAIFWRLLSWAAAVPAGIAWLVVGVRVAGPWVRRRPPSVQGDLQH